MIAREGTFDYVGIVPSHGELPWALELRTATDRRDPSEPSLMGVNAQLMLEEAGLTPNAGFHRGVWRPAVLRVRCILAAKAVPGPRRAAFYMDQAVARALKPGDVLHLSGTGCGGLGLSLLRSGRLVVALGAVTSVPLGEGVSVRFPSDLVSAAEAVFRRSDPTFEFQECPLEITIDGETGLLPGGGAAFAGWEVTVFGGLRPGFPGTDESVAIYRPSLCSRSGANASAQLMVDGLSMPD